MLLTLTINAQDLTFAKDYYQNHALLNPAYFAKYLFINFDIVATRYWIYPDAPEQLSLWSSFKFRSVSLGLLIAGYKEAAFRKMNLSLNYSYDITIDRHSNTHLSFGLNTALMQDFVDIDQLHTLEYDPFLANQQILSRYYPQIAFGTMLFNDKFETGLALTRVLPFSGYFFLNHTYVLPPVFIFHAGYFYEDFPLSRYLLNPEIVLFASKNYTRVDLNGSIYLWKRVKFSGGLINEYLSNKKIYGFSWFAGFGIKIGSGFYLNLQLNFNRVNLPTPLFTKLGNSVMVRYDVYPYEYSVPRFF